MTTAASAPTGLEHAARITAGEPGHAEKGMAVAGPAPRLIEPTGRPSPPPLPGRDRNDAPRVRTHRLERTARTAADEPDHADKDMAVAGPAPGLIEPTGRRVRRLR
ncbi:hypothetical protein ACWC2T_31860 [Streptomyces sp. NPDC001393]